MLPFHLVWATWAIGWVLAARWTAPAIEREPYRSRLIVRTLMTVGFVLLLWPRLERAIGLASRVVPPGPLGPAAGLGLTLLGLGSASWARVELGRFWSGTVTLKSGHVLVRSGPYGMVRHPIYVGLLLAVLGTAGARGTAGAAVALVIVGIACGLKIEREESLLSRHFGESYAEYRRQVSRLIPLVW